MVDAPPNKEGVEDVGVLFVVPKRLVEGGFEVFAEACPNRLLVLPAVLVLPKDHPGWDFDGSAIAPFCLSSGFRDAIASKL